MYERDYDDYSRVNYKSANTDSDDGLGCGLGCLSWIIIIIIVVIIAIVDIKKEQSDDNTKEQSTRQKTEQSVQTDRNPEYDEFVNQQIQHYYKKLEREYYLDQQDVPYHF